MRKLLLLFALIAGSVASYADDLLTAKVMDSETIELCLTNSVNYVAFQMDITLPAGASFEADDVTITVRTGDAGWQDGEDENSLGTTEFQIATNCIDANNNTYRIVGYSLGNHIIEGTPGESIATITLTLTGQAEDCTVDDIVSGSALANVIFVTETDLEEVILAAEILAEAGFNPADINKDGTVNASDIVAFLEIMAIGDTPTAVSANASEEILNAYSLQAADVNGDDKFNAQDIVGIIALVGTTY